MRLKKVILSLSQTWWITVIWWIIQCSISDLENRFITADRFFQLRLKGRKCFCHHCLTLHQDAENKPRQFICLCGREREFRDEHESEWTSTVFKVFMSHLPLTFQTLVCLTLSGFCFRNEFPVILITFYTIICILCLFLFLTKNWRGFFFNEFVVVLCLRFGLRGWDCSVSCSEV